MPSICFTCVMELVSNALNDRTSLNAEETIWTTPSAEPRKRFAEPVQRHEISPYTSRVSCWTWERLARVYVEHGCDIVWELDLGDVEEVERFPLYG